MLVRFWGTRGSIPAPGRRTAFFGGNTSCVEVQAEDGQVLLLDCGTGARPLGLDLLSRGSGLPPIHILVTHTHWDHIQGFPFFVPAYVPGSRLTVYGARGLDRTLEGSLAGQMQHTYFPVQLGELRAEINFTEVSEERFTLGNYRVTTQYLNHTAPTVGYCLEAGGLKFVYSTDHEPFWWTPGHSRTPHSFDHPGEQRHLEFVAGADLLVHDSQYSDREYPAKRGWGHSTIEYVTDLAVRAGVKQLVLYHHEPLHTDSWIRSQTDRARRRARAQGSDLQILAAAEGLEIHLPEMSSSADLATTGAAPLHPLAIPTGRVLIVGADTDAIREVREALAADAYQITATADADLTAVVARARPDVVIFVGSGSESSLLELVGRVREKGWGQKLPILVLAGAEGPGAAARLIGGVTDVLSRPFSPPMLRVRLRAWLSRAGRMTHRQTTPRKFRLFGTPSTDGLGLLKGLPFNERAALLAGAITTRFRPGDVIFRQGDPAGGVYFLRAGRVQISIQLPGGGEVPLAIAEAGDTVGELAALDGGPRTATALAIEPTTADYVPPETFESGLAAAPGATLRLLRLMAGRLRQTDRQVGELIVRSITPEEAAAGLLDR